MEAIIVLFFIIILVQFGGMFDAPWIPTKKSDYDRIAKLVDLRSDLVFYDLGSGTGKLLFYLSKKYGCQCVGIEISPFLYLYSKIKSLFFKNVTIKYGNIFLHDLSAADVICVFLHPKIYNKLHKKIISGAKKEAEIVLACWPFENIKPRQSDIKKNEIALYLYKNPAP